MTTGRAEHREHPPAAPYPAQAPNSAGLFDRARAVIPGGVNSPVRAFHAVGGTPRFMALGHGPYLTDADGREYVDLVCSWGPLLHGHAHPVVLEAVQRAAASGTSYGAPTEGEVVLAEELVARAPVEQVRLVSSGTEATMSAVRLARGVTGRSRIVKFAGCYHGHVDALLAAAGSGVATLGLPDSVGVTPAETSATIVVPYNDRDAVSAAFAAAGHQIAAIVTEAAAGNMGVVPPRDGFNAFLRETTHAHGALLIVDEVMTGFRVARSGWYGLDPVAGDITTFGKVMGGGFPAAAFGGSAVIMGHLAPAGPVYQAGTLSGNPVATAAGLATLQLADEGAYARLDATSLRLRAEVAAALTAASVPHVFGVAGSMFSVFFTDPARTPQVSDYGQARTQDAGVYAAFFHAMLSRGVYLPPSGYESWFVSTVHDDAALDRVVAALPAAAAAAAGATGAAAAAGATGAAAAAGATG